jgi:hypothetical protein
VVLLLAPELDAGAPQSRLPDPCGALEPEGERTTVTFEEATDPIELRFAADNVLEREASFPDCRQRLPPFPQRTPPPFIPTTTQPDVSGHAAKLWGFLHFIPSFVGLASRE